VDDGSFSMVLVPQSLLMTWVEYWRNCSNPSFI
jgi:hypothetical protein